MSVLLDSISFENYRQYGTASLEFRTSGKSKLSVLVAKNGTGKTTLLNAITWCLFGREWHLADAATALPKVNMAVAKAHEGAMLIPVSVALTILDDDCEDGTLKIDFERRTGYKKVTSGSGSVRFLEGESSFFVRVTDVGGFRNTRVCRDEMAEYMVSRYFDSSIFKYYFFDGEKLSSFFDTKKSTDIRQSVFNIAQVSLLESACCRLDKISTEKQRVLGKNSPDLERLTSEKEAAKEELEKVDEVLRMGMENIERKREELSEIDKRLSEHRPIRERQATRMALEAELKKIEVEKSAHHDAMRKFIRDYVIILGFYPQAKKLLDFIKVKERQNELPPSFDRNQILKLLEMPDKPCPLCHSVITAKGRKHLEKLLEKYTVSSRASHTLMEIKFALEQFCRKAHAYKSELDALNRRKQDLTSRENKVVARLTEISAYFSQLGNLYEAWNDVPMMENRRRELFDAISKTDQNIGRFQNQRGMLNRKIEGLTEAFNTALKSSAANRQTQMQLEVCETLLDCLLSIKKDLIDEMRNTIQKDTSSYFKRLMWKEGTFGDIEIDASYNIALSSKDGPVMTGSLSAAEQMALAYSFTLAIHKASGRNSPLVIDSPLGRSSSENRVNMAQALLTASKEKQIIMLLTPDEFTPDVQKLYKGVAEIRPLNLSKDESHIEGI